MIIFCGNISVEITQKFLFPYLSKCNGFLIYVSLLKNSFLLGERMRHQQKP